MLLRVMWFTAIAAAIFLVGSSFYRLTKPSFVVRKIQIIQQPQQP
jgi:hypothetical protein